MNELALFVGAGGGLLGSRLLGWRTVCAVEKEPYAREVLLRRQRDGMLDLFPIWDEVQTFDGRPWRGLVDIVTAGFPCQPWSHAGPQRGEDDNRNLWPATLRILREARPRFVLLENVAALASHWYFGVVLWDLAQSGFDCRWDCIPAASVGAPHRRDRLWIHGHANGQGESTFAVNAEAPGLPAVGDTGSVGCEGVHGRQQKSEPAVRGRWWAVEPELGRVAHELPDRLDIAGGIG